MGPGHIITDKDVLRNDPPDILLTNYKMLDFLLIRPRDQALWRFNGPDTLRYLVVDELHTFDGAQGTDLAMLIRRLRHRLQCDAQDDTGRLICIGTSATLGDASDTRPLRDYAGQVFATAFDEHSVITERRQGFDAFIGERGGRASHRRRRDGAARPFARGPSCDPRRRWRRFCLPSSPTRMSWPSCKPASTPRWAGCGWARS